MLRLKLLDLVAKGIDRLALKQIKLSPFCIVKGIAVQQHNEPFHFDTPDLLGKDGETFALELAICHCHVSVLQKIQQDLQRAWMYAPWLS